MNGTNRASIKKIRGEIKWRIMWTERKNQGWIEREEKRMNLETKEGELGEVSEKRERKEWEA